MMLEVLIVTHQKEGIERVAAMGLPRAEDVRYLVSWQAHGQAPVPPELAEREDVKVYRFDETGVSCNRNNLLRLSHAEVVLIADDDLRFRPEAFGKILDIFRANPRLQYASFRYDGPDGKQYPADTCSLRRTPKGFYQTAFEVALRRSAIDAGLRFNPCFGPGAEQLLAGEDEMLLLTAQRMGLDCRYYPLTICAHPSVTTGNRLQTPGTLRAMGAFLVLKYRFTAILRWALKAKRLHQQGLATYHDALTYMAQGMLYADFHRRSLLHAHEEV